MDIEKFKYEFNLVATGRVKDFYQFGDIVNNGKPYDIDFDSVISLKDMVTIFNQAYLAFLGDYQKLLSLDFLGKEISFSHLLLNKETKTRYLYFIVSNPKKEYFDETLAVLSFCDFGGDIVGYMANDFYRIDRKIKELDIDKSLIKAYLNVMEKHYLLGECFRCLKNFNMAIGCGFPSLIINTTGELLDGLKNFNIHFGTFSINYAELISLCYNLGPNWGLDYQKSEIMINDSKLENQERNLDILSQDIYLNEDKLPDLFKKNKMLVRSK